MGEIGEGASHSLLWTDVWYEWRRRDNREGEEMEKEVWDTDVSEAEGKDQSEDESDQKGIQQKYKLWLITNHTQKQLQFQAVARLPKM